MKEYTEIDSLRQRLDDAHESAARLRDRIAALESELSDANKIPGLDCFDMSARKNGKIAIRLESGEVIYITVDFQNPSSSDQ